MKKIFILPILFLLFSVSLSAKENYIQVMSISDPNYLHSVKKRINNLGYKTYVKKLGKWNIVYSGPFENTADANKALIRVKKNISKDAFLTKITPKKSKEKIEPVKKEEKKQAVQKVTLEDIIVPKKKATMPVKETNTKALKTQKQKKVITPPSPSKQTVEKAEKSIIDKITYVDAKGEKGFYIALTTGLSLVNIQQTGTLPLDIKLDDSGLNISPEIGYYYNDNIFISLNYQYTDLKAVTLNSILGTINYQLDEFYSISPFLGLIAGYSTREWEKDPVSSSVDFPAVSSFVGGIQAGSEIEFDYLTLYLYYRYLFMDTTTELYDSARSNKIEYGNEESFNLGVKYNF